MSNTVPNKKPPRTRILSCHFTHLPTDRHARQKWGKSWRVKSRPDHAPIVIIDTIKNAMRIVAMESDDRLSGIQVGQTLSDARAIYPDLDCIHYDEKADKTLLTNIARWCERYTPLIAIADKDTLFLDITGCAHLFDGEEKLADDLSARLNAQGFGTNVSIADNAGAAWALSHYRVCRNAPPLAHADLLYPLPLTALRIDKDQSREMSKLGLKTIGCIADLPRAPLAARFGNGVLKRLGQALGFEDEVISPLRPISELTTERRFPEPLAYEDDIKATIALLAKTLSQSLEEKGLGMRQCELTLFRADGDVVSLKVEASNALRDPHRITALFDERLAALHDEWDAGFGFDVIRLGILRTDPLDATQKDMIHGESGEQDVNHLIDRLSARLGATRVAIVCQADTHIPERRFSKLPALHHKSQTEKNDLLPLDTATRPIVLLKRPELAQVLAEVPEGPPIRFRWRKVQYQVSRSEGPERIACEWWKDGRAAHSRDYFRVETQDGYRLWLFRHGLYERETSSPQWYVHGMFA